MARIDGTKVWTNKVRLSFVHLFEPKTAINSKGDERKKYEVTILIPKSDTETVKHMKKAFDNAIEAGKDRHFAGKVPKNLQIKYKDGDEYFDLDKYPENEGHWVLGLSSNTKPGIIDKNREAITDPDEIYSGCFARVTFNAATYNVKNESGISKGVTAYVQNVQKIADGDHLGAHNPDPEDDFEAWEDEDEDDDFVI